jgi:hypothetical protein
MSKVKEFHKAVRKHFSFLTKRGFSVDERLEEHACWLTYESSKVSVLLCYGPPEFEASLSFWANSSPKLTLAVGDLSVVGQRPESWTSAPRTKEIEAHVSWLASAIQSVEEQLCSGDPLFYELLSSARRAAIAEWGQAEKLRAMRSKAEVAWKKKQYAEVVALYGSAAGILSALEKKRLTYAEKKTTVVAK